MSRIVSTYKMASCCEGLIDTKDVNDRANQFLKSVIPKVKAAQQLNRPHGLTDPQLDWLEAIWKQHFG